MPVSGGRAPRSIVRSTFRQRKVGGGAFAAQLVGDSSIAGAHQGGPPTGATSGRAPCALAARPIWWNRQRPRCKPGARATSVRGPRRCVGPRRLAAPSARPEGRGREISWRSTPRSVQRTGRCRAAQPGPWRRPSGPRERTATASSHTRGWTCGANTQGRRQPRRALLAARCKLAVRAHGKHGRGERRGGRTDAKSPHGRTRCVFGLGCRRSDPCTRVTRTKPAYCVLGRNFWAYIGYRGAVETPASAGLGLHDGRGTPREAQGA